MFLRKLGHHAPLTNSFIRTENSFIRREPYIIGKLVIHMHRIIWGYSENAIFVACLLEHIYKLGYFYGLFYSNKKYIQIFPLSIEYLDMKIINLTTKQTSSAHWPCCDCILKLLADDTAICKSYN